MGLFDAVNHAFGTLLNSSDTVGGYLVGFLLFATIAAALVLVMNRREESVLSGAGLLIPFGSALAVVYAFGLWPIWTVVPIGGVIAVIVYRNMRGD